jgi:RNA polymerase sigma factor (sigma-70 family)
LGELKRGNSRAAGKLWSRYFPKLVRLADRSLHRSPRGAADEEDVALSALHRFFQAVEQGRYGQVADRHDLWRLLEKITQRKAIDLARHGRRLRRGGGKWPRSIDSQTADFPTDGSHGAAPVSRDPSPELSAMMAEQCRRLLEGLPDEQLRVLAVAKLEGHTNEEIARQLAVSLRTVERRLRLIRDEWKQELQ